MVQYIITPWRNHQELLEVRDNFYPRPADNDSESEDDRRQAVARVAVWVQRGNCPHLVESTAILISAILNDKPHNEPYAIRAAYSTAFCRFVTGLLDGYQEGRQKISMYSIAKNIGLPATFVELRHQCTHEELPSLYNLRNAAEKSLSWIDEHYWRDIDDATGPSTDPSECQMAAREYLQWKSTDPGQDDTREEDYLVLLGRWHKEELLEALEKLEDSNSLDLPTTLQALRLKGALLSGNIEPVIRSKGLENVPHMDAASIQAVRLEMAEARRALDEDKDEPVQHPSGSKTEKDEVGSVEADEGMPTIKGWTMWKGPWTPKPIGMV